MFEPILDHMLITDSGHSYDGISMIHVAYVCDRHTKGQMLSLTALTCCHDVIMMSHCLVCHGIYLPLIYIDGFDITAHFMYSMLATAPVIDFISLSYQLIAF